MERNDYMHFCIIPTLPAVSSTYLSLFAVALKAQRFFSLLRRCYLGEHLPSVSAYWSIISLCALKAQFRCLLLLLCFAFCLEGTSFLAFQVLIPNVEMMWKNFCVFGFAFARSFRSSSLQGLPAVVKVILRLLVIISNFYNQKLPTKSHFYQYTRKGSNWSLSPWKWGVSPKQGPKWWCDSKKQGTSHSFVCSLMYHTCSLQEPRISKTNNGSH